MLISGAMHDLDHPGHNNLFEINSDSPLSLTYNDKSVLENYHLYFFFNLLSNDQLNIFGDKDIDHQKKIRRSFIVNIIATDMTNHKADIERLNWLFDSKEPNEFTGDDKALVNKFSKYLILKQKFKK